MDRHKELKLAYKLNPRPMGVYQIKNNISGKIFIGSSMNLPGKRNSYQFQLKQGCHFNKELQTDWNSFGAEAFTFDVLETIKATEIPEAEWRKATTALEEKWLDKLQPYGDKGYNKQKQ